MSDTSFGDYGDTSGGGKAGGSDSSSPFGDLSLGSAGALGVGALGLGSILAKGPDQLPPQFGALQQNIPWLQGTGQQTIGQGQTLVGQGTEALAMAQHGQLTPEQQAQLGVYEKGLTNEARQMYFNMGVDPSKSTSFLSTTADIDAKVNAMAQQEIQSTIQLGLGELSGGSSLIGQGLGFENAANQALITAGEAQIKQDQAYSSSLTSAFSAIGSLFGTIGKAAILA